MRSCSVALLACLLAAGFPSRAVSGADPGSPAIAEVEALENFDFLWETIRDTHFDEDLDGVDWAAVRDEFRPRAAGCRDLGALRRVLGRALTRLGQSHFAVLPADAGAGARRPDLATLIDRSFTAIPDHTGRPGPGLEARDVAGDLVVSRVLAGSGAEKAGVRPGWIVEAVAGHPLDDVARRVRDAATRYGLGQESIHRYGVWFVALQLMAGEAGSGVRLLLRDGAGMPVEHDLERRDPPWPTEAVGGLPPLPLRVASRTLATDAGTTIGLIEIPTIWLPGTVVLFEDALAAVAGADALVLDLRGNMGGLINAAQGVAGYLVDETFSLGMSMSRTGGYPNLVFPRRVGTRGQPIAPPGVPLALLVDGLTGSASEVFAAGLQDAGLARLIGEPTAGAALPATITTMPNGDRLLHAIHDFIRVDGTRIEDNPVRPDIPARPTRRDLLAGRDAAVVVAAAWADRQLSKHVGGRP